MQKKLTITVDEKVYEGLHRVIGRGNISRFIEDLTRPYVFAKASRRKQAKKTSSGGKGDDKEAFLKLCDELAKTAKRNGMTEEILQSILNSED